MAAPAPEGRFIDGKWVTLKNDPDLVEYREIPVQGGFIYVKAPPKKQI